MRKPNQHLSTKRKKPKKVSLLDSVSLCKSLGVRKDTLSRWRKLGLKPDGSGPGKRGQKADLWDLKRVREWMVANVDVKAVSEAIPGASEKKNEDPAATMNQPRGDGLLAMLERVRQAERVEFGRYVKAMKVDDLLSIRARRSGWHQSVEQLRKLEKDAPEIRRASGELVDKNVANQEMIRMCLTVKQQMMSLRSSLPAILVGRDEAAMSIIIEKAVRDACVALSTGDVSNESKIEKAVSEILHVH